MEPYVRFHHRVGAVTVWECIGRAHRVLGASIVGALENWHARRVAIARIAGQPRDAKGRFGPC